MLEGSHLSAWQRRGLLSDWRSAPLAADPSVLYGSLPRLLPEPPSRLRSSPNLPIRSSPPAHHPSSPTSPCSPSPARQGSRLKGSEANAHLLFNTYQPRPRTSSRAASATACRSCAKSHSSPFHYPLHHTTHYTPSPSNSPSHTTRPSQASKSIRTNPPQSSPMLRPRASSASARGGRSHSCSHGGQREGPSLLGTRVDHLHRLSPAPCLLSCERSPCRGRGGARNWARRVGRGEEGREAPGEARGEGIGQTGSCASCETTDEGRESGDGGVSVNTLLFLLPNATKSQPEWPNPGLAMGASPFYLPRRLLLPDERPGTAPPLLEGREGDGNAASSPTTAPFDGAKQFMRRRAPRSIQARLAAREKALYSVELEAEEGGRQGVEREGGGSGNAQMSAPPSIDPWMEAEAEGAAEAACGLEDGPPPPLASLEPPFGQYEQMTPASNQEEDARERMSGEEESDRESRQVVETGEREDDRREREGIEGGEVQQEMDREGGEVGDAQQDGQGDGETWAVQRVGEVVKEQCSGGGSSKVDTRADGSPSGEKRVERSRMRRAQDKRSPKSETQVEQSPSSETPIEGTPSGRTQVDSSPSSGAPVERSPNSGAQVERSPSSGAPLERSPSSMTPVEMSPSSRIQVEMSANSETQVERSSRTRVERSLSSRSRSRSPPPRPVLSPAPQEVAEECDPLWTSAPLFLTARPEGSSAIGLDEAVKEARSIQLIGANASHVVLEAIKKLEEMTHEYKRAATSRGVRFGAFKACEPIKELLTELQKMMSEGGTQGVGRSEFLNLHLSLSREGFLTEELVGEEVGSYPFCWSAPAYMQFLQASERGGNNHASSNPESLLDSNLPRRASSAALYASVNVDDPSLISSSSSEEESEEDGEESEESSEESGPSVGWAMLQRFIPWDEGFHLWNMLLHRGALRDHTLLPERLEEAMFELADAYLTTKHSPEKRDVRVHLREYHSFLHDVVTTIRHKTAPEPSPSSSLRHGEAPPSRRSSSHIMLPQSLKHRWPAFDAHLPEVCRKVLMVQHALMRPGERRVTRERAMSEFDTFCHLSRVKGWRLSYTQIDRALHKMKTDLYRDLLFRHAVVAREKGGANDLLEAIVTDTEQMLCFLRYLDCDCDGFISQRDFCLVMTGAVEHDVLSATSSEQMHSRWVAADRKLAERAQTLNRALSMKSLSLAVQEDDGNAAGMSDDDGEGGEGDCYIGNREGSAAPIEKSKVQAGTGDASNGGAICGGVPAKAVKSWHNDRAALDGRGRKRGSLESSSDF